MEIERANSSDLVVNGLPDGSKVIVDSKSEQVYALNATAGAAWDACGDPTTVSRVAEQMGRSLSSTVSDEVAEQAILQLEEKNLVTVSGSAKLTRRQTLATLGAVALPLVVSMTMADQKAFAQQARSIGNDPGGDTDWHHRRPKPHVSHGSGPNY
jgi:Coenzyme PQQ synthesis protein D (PqqD)